MTTLSAVIITLNEEENIAHCLDSLQGLASEIVVVDSHSTDRTMEICKRYNCKIFTRDFDGYGIQKQFAVDQSTGTWVLSIDADEVVTNELKREILHLLEEKDPPFSGYEIPFSFLYLGRILRYSKEIHLRLFNRDKGHFTQVAVHEGIVVKGPIGRLRGKIIHRSYRDISHHLQKINSYTTQAASEYAKSGKRYSKGWVAIKFPASFIQFYFFKLGILDGYPGFLWSFFSAFYAALKIAKTIELNSKVK
jgi:glycosyltransferase involved in cell wall biosynthesis